MKKIKTVASSACALVLDESERLAITLVAVEHFLSFNIGETFAPVNTEQYIHAYNIRASACRNLEFYHIKMSPADAPCKLL